MVKKASKKCHIPYRTCVVCKKKDEKFNLQRFIIRYSVVIFDDKQELPGRGFYCCRNKKCLASVGKWIKKRKKL